MSDSPRINRSRARSRLAYWGITLVGAGAFCVYSRSWHDYRHAIYDVSSSLAVFSFVAQVVVSGVAGQRDLAWRVRLGLLLPMSVVPVGRALLGWPISGHLTDVTIVAGIQTTNRSLGGWARWLYWAPVALALWIRWRYLDLGGHRETYAAFVVAVACLAAAMMFERAGPRGIRAD
jgi:hypothetical protein